MTSPKHICYTDYTTYTRSDDDGYWRKNTFFPHSAWNDTKNNLGTIVGFPERSADVRLAQYETGTRKPKAELTAALAQALDVSPHALDVPDIDSYIGLMHTLFTLEDLYGLTVSEADGEICLKVNKEKEKRHELLKNVLMLGKSRRTSYLPKKSAGKNTITGVTLSGIRYHTEMGKSTLTGT